ncbi:MAG: rhamnose transport system permease protein [Solirubrobacteraceae bacterium]|nr:rhamnose transport system permease protein [Solirubrobacteraceae bacterium]MEA2317226.1 rhamnose transport system permease protein [Solirubrobacteraceae bacterium]
MQAETHSTATAPEPQAAGAPAPASPPASARLKAAAGSWEALLVGFLVVLAIVGQGLSSEFLTTDSFTTGSLDFSEVALMALPLALVIIAAEIDLSVASVLALSSAMMAALWNGGLPLEVIMPLCIVAGALCGAFNGFLVTRLGLPSLAVTIGTLALFRGLAFVVIGDQSVTDFPTTWTDRAFGNFAGTFVPNAIVLFAILAIAFAVLLHATPFGRSVYAIGANEEAAYFSGLRVKRIKMTLFVLSGAVAALAGIVISLRNSTAAANVGQGFELTAITAVLLGGVSIFGGRGTIGGVILALFLLGGIQKALTLSESISSYWIQIVTGVLLVGSVLGPNVVRRVNEARRRRASHSMEEDQK